MGQGRGRESGLGYRPGEWAMGEWARAEAGIVGQDRGQESGPG